MGEAQALDAAQIGLPESVRAPHQQTIQCWYILPPALARSQASPVGAHQLKQSPEWLPAQTSLQLDGTDARPPPPAEKP